MPMALSRMQLQIFKQILLQQLTLFKGRSTPVTYRPNSDCDSLTLKTVRALIMKVCADLVISVFKNLQFSKTF